MKTNSKILIIITGVLVLGVIVLTFLNSSEQKINIEEDPTTVEQEESVNEEHNEEHNEEPNGDSVESMDGEIVSIDFSTAETEDGEVFDPSEYVDKNLIITFTNSACPHCDDQALEYERMRDDLDFEMFYIPTKETTKATSNVLDAIGISDYKLIIDRGHTLLDVLSVKMVPTSLVKRKGEEHFRVIEGILREAPREGKENDRLLKDYID